MGTPASTKTYKPQGGDSWQIGSGGILNIQAGGKITSGAEGSEAQAAAIAQTTDSSGGVASDTIAALTNLGTLTDNSGGAASTTFAAITAGAAYAQADMTAAKNAIASLSAQLTLQKAANTVLLNAVASLTAKLNSIQTAIKNVGITA